VGPAGIAAAVGIALAGLGGAGGAEGESFFCCRVPGTVPRVGTRHPCLCVAALSFRHGRWDCRGPWGERDKTPPGCH